MIDSHSLSSALTLLFSSMDPWLYVAPGIIIGLIFGAIPGLQISMAMAVFLPASMMMDFLQAILFLTGIFTGGAFRRRGLGHTHEYTGLLIGGGHGL